MPVVIPERWKLTYDDWGGSHSAYAWKHTARKAVEELGAAELKLSQYESSIPERQNKAYGPRPKRIYDDWEEVLQTAKRHKEQDPWFSNKLCEAIEVIRLEQSRSRHGDELLGEEYDKRIAAEDKVEEQAATIAELTAAVNEYLIDHEEGNCRFTVVGHAGKCEICKMARATTRSSDV